MRRLLTGYAISYNYRHRRYGHLFQNRYKSILCQENTYLFELVRYIHLNPLRAGEQFERRYDLKAKGCNFDTVVERVVQLLGMESNQVLTNSKNRQSVRARSLVCFWAFSELGITQTELAQRFRISQPAVSSAVRKGEKLVWADRYELVEPKKL
jgi:hypothetical protein